MTPLEKVVERLEVKGCNPRPRAGQWQSQCPAHEDKTPSLSITETGEGKVLLHCHAGCDSRAVMDSLELEYKDLFTPDPQRDTGRKQKEYIYRDADSEPVFRVVKYLDQDGNKSFRQNAYLGDGNYAHTLGQTTKILYCLPRVISAINTGRHIWIVEGEKDVENLSFATGAIATCNPGGADNGTGGKFTPPMIASLDGAIGINIIIDNDAPGERHGRYLAENLTSPVMVWRSPFAKDISDHLKDGHGLADLELLYDSTEPNEWLHTALPTEPIAADPDDHGWQFKTLGEHIGSGWEDVNPTILTKTDGQSLFYRGKVNSIYGESGCCKTWVLALAMAQELAQGHDIAYIDFEDRASTLAERLYILGCNKTQVEQHTHYSHPYAANTPQEIENLVEYLTVRNVTLVGIDSTGEALALNSLNPNADEEVAAWYREIPKRLAETEASIVLVDHSPKNDDHSSGHAIGSQRKKAAIDGASYKIKNPTPFSKEYSTKIGKVTIKCTKDRHGTYANGAQVADILVAHLDPTAPRTNEFHTLRMTILDPKSDTSEESIDQIILKYLADQPEQSVTADKMDGGLMALGVSPRELIRDTRVRLVNEGKLCLEKVSGKHIYSLPNDLAEPSENNAFGEVSGEVITSLNDLAETPRQNLATLALSRILDGEPTATGILSSTARRNAAVLNAADGEVLREPTLDEDLDEAIYAEIDNQYDRKEGR